MVVKTITEWEMGHFVILDKTKQRESVMQMTIKMRKLINISFRHIQPDDAVIFLTILKSATIEEPET